MFCPNCGTQNPETAATCSKCGFAMKSAAPKFKGTMLMMNQPGGAPGMPGMPGAPPPAAPPPAAGGAPPSGNPSFQAEAPPLGGATGAGPAGPSRLKGTIVGVAPPKAGAAPAPMPGAPSGGGTQAMPMPPVAGGPEHQFGSAQGVNALGSTVALGDNGLPPGFSLPDAPAGGGGGVYGAPPPAPAPDFGAPPPAAPGGFGAPPPDFGAPPPGGNFGAPPPGQYGAPPQDYGMGAPPMQQQQPGGYPGGAMQQYPGGPMMGPSGVPNLMAATGEGKSWMVTLLLCGFLGYVGAHRFYTGHYLLGALQLITCGGFGVWAFVDLIFILMGKYTDAQGRPLVKN